MSGVRRTGPAQPVDSNINPKPNPTTAKKHRTTNKPNLPAHSQIHRVSSSTSPSIALTEKHTVEHLKGNEPKWGILKTIVACVGLGIAGSFKVFDSPYNPSLFTQPLIDFSNTTPTLVNTTVLEQSTSIYPETFFEESITNATFNASVAIDSPTIKEEATSTSKNQTESNKTNEVSSKNKNTRRDKKSKSSRRSNKAQVSEQQTVAKSKNNTQKTDYEGRLVKDDARKESKPTHPTDVSKIDANAKQHTEIQKAQSNEVQIYKTKNSHRKSKKSNSSRRSNKTQVSEQQTAPPAKSSKKTGRLEKPLASDNKIVNPKKIKEESTTEIRINELVKDWKEEIDQETKNWLISLSPEELIFGDDYILVSDKALNSRNIASIHVSKKNNDILKLLGFMPLEMRKDSEGYLSYRLPKDWVISSRNPLEIKDQFNNVQLVTEKRFSGVIFTFPQIVKDFNNLASEMEGMSPAERLIKFKAFYSILNANSEFNNGLTDSALEAHANLIRLFPHLRDIKEAYADINQIIKNHMRLTDMHNFLRPQIYATLINMMENDFIDLDLTEKILKYWVLDRLKENAFVGVFTSVLPLDILAKEYNRGNLSEEDKAILILDEKKLMLDFLITVLNKVDLNENANIKEVIKEITEKLNGENIDDVDLKNKVDNINRLID